MSDHTRSTPTQPKAKPGKHQPTANRFPEWDSDPLRWDLLMDPKVAFKERLLVLWLGWSFDDHVIDLTSESTLKQLGLPISKKSYQALEQAQRELIDERKLFKWVPRKRKGVVFRVICRVYKRGEEQPEYYKRAKRTIRDKGQLVRLHLIDITKWPKVGQLIPGNTKLFAKQSLDDFVRDLGIAPGTVQKYLRVWLDAGTLPITWFGGNHGQEPSYFLRNIDHPAWNDARQLLEGDYGEHLRKAKERRKVVRAQDADTVDG
jgi:hypothetical protein